MFAADPRESSSRKNEIDLGEPRKDAREAMDEEEEERIGILDLPLLTSSLASLDCSDTYTIGVALVHINDAVNLNSKMAISMIKNDHIRQIASFITVPDISDEALYTLSLIISYSTQYNGFFATEEFVEIIRSASAFFKQKHVHYLSSLLSNLLCDDPGYFVIVRDADLLSIIFCVEKLPREAIRLISLSLMNENIEIDRFNELIRTQTGFLHDFNMTDQDSLYKSILKKYDIVLAFELILLNSQTHTKKCQALAAYILNNGIIQCLMKIAENALDKISAKALHVLELLTKSDSIISNTLLNLNYFDILPTLIESLNDELSSQAMRCATSMICAFPELSQAGTHVFQQFEYYNRFQFGNFVMKQAVVSMLIQIVDEFTEEQRVMIFSLEFLNDLISFLDVEEEKSTVYSLIGRLLCCVSDRTWIFALLDECSFWDLVENDHFNLTNESVVKTTEELMRIHGYFTDPQQQQQYPPEQNEEEENILF